MRDLAQVIDALLAVIPKEESVLRERLCVIAHQLAYSDDPGSRNHRHVTGIILGDMVPSNAPWAPEALRIWNGAS